MSRLWVPPRVSDEYRDERRQYEAELMSTLELEGRLEEWNRDLQRIDPDLQMAFCPAEAKPVAGLNPGHYHLIRNNHDAPPTIVPIVGSQGEFVEPNSSVFQWLAESDLWNDRARHARERAESEIEQAKRRRQERERDELREEFSDRAKAAFNPGVSFTDAGKWRYRAGARTEKKAA